MNQRTIPSEKTRKLLSSALKKAWKEGRKKLHPNTLKNFETLNKGKLGDEHPCGGKKHSSWKGDDVGYLALHAWIRRRKGKPDACENCPLKGLYGQKIHWANIDGKYRRNLEDWIRLCAKCHRKHDDKKNLRSIVKDRR